MTVFTSIQHGSLKLSILQTAYRQVYSYSNWVPHHFNALIKSPWFRAEVPAFIINLRWTYYLGSENYSLNTIKHYFSEVFITQVFSLPLAWQQISLWRTKQQPRAGSRDRTSILRAASKTLSHLSLTLHLESMSEAATPARPLGQCWHFLFARDPFRTPQAAALHDPASLLAPNPHSLWACKQVKLLLNIFQQQIVLLQQKRLWRVLHSEIFHVLISIWKTLQQGFWIHQLSVGTHLKEAPTLQVETPNSSHTSRPSTA